MFLHLLLCLWVLYFFADLLKHKSQPDVAADSAAEWVVSEREMKERLKKEKEEKDLKSKQDKEKKRKAAAQKEMEKKELEKKELEAERKRVQEKEKVDALFAATPVSQDGAALESNVVAETHESVPEPTAQQETVTAPPAGDDGSDSESDDSDEENVPPQHPQAPVRNEPVFDNSAWPAAPPYQGGWGH